MEVDPLAQITAGNVNIILEIWQQNHELRRDGDLYANPLNILVSDFSFLKKCQKWDSEQIQRKHREVYFVVKNISRIIRTCSSASCFIWKKRSSGRLV